MIIFSTYRSILMQVVKCLILFWQSGSGKVRKDQLIFIGMIQGLENIL